MEKMPVKCDHCNVAAHVITEGTTPKRVICPQCGASEDYGTVVKSIGQQATAYAADKISKSLIKAARGSKTLRYTPGTVRHSRSKFRADLS